MAKPPRKKALDPKRKKIPDPKRKKALDPKRLTKKKRALKSAVKQTARRPLHQHVPPAAPIDPAAVPTEATCAVLDRLWGVVMTRRDADPNFSHSARLLQRGTAKVAQKFGEEAVECLIEATRGNRAGLVAESADVLYHMIVMWVDAGLRPEEVWAELHRREGVSGIAEKAARVRELPLVFGLGTTKIP